MKNLCLYAIVVMLTVLFAAVQPGDGMLEAYAANALVEPDLQTACKTPACLTGWQAANDRAISDENECDLISNEPDEVAGCRAFTHTVLQARLENQW